MISKLNVTLILVLIASIANAQETVKSESTYERKITDDVMQNTLKAEYPSDKWKVVPREEVCVPPAPCGKKTEETVATLDKKLKYECPPCRKCVKELNQIKDLKNDISEYLREISELKNQIAELERKLKEAEGKPPIVKIEEKRVPDNKKNFIYFSPMYAQDGINATDKDENAVYEAEPVTSTLVGGGYTRFFDISEKLDLGVGVGGHVGQTGYGVNAQIGVKF